VRFALARYRTDGSLDQSFDDDGKLTTNLSPSRDVVTGVAIQADGKIVAAGVAGVVADSRFAVARYNANGSLDVSLTGDGKVTTDFTPERDSATAVAIQADGKIVAVGIAGSERSNTKFALARYLAA
jgi:serralysin